MAANCDARADASLLSAAIERGFSSDGEVFDVHDLAVLAAEVCGLEARVLCLGQAHDASNTSGAAGAPSADVAADAAALARPAHAFVRALAAWLGSGGLAVMPYDKDEATHTPVLRGGRAAHYLVVVGLATPAGEEAAEPARLICVHGLSRRPLVLPPSELLASNAQLTQMKQGVNTKRWVVKEGGVRLARRVLLLAAPRSLPVCLT